MFGIYYNSNGKRGSPKYFSITSPNLVSFTGSINEIQEKLNIIRGEGCLSADIIINGFSIKCDKEGYLDNIHYISDKSIKDFNSDEISVEQFIEMVSIISKNEDGKIRGMLKYMDLADKLMLKLNEMDMSEKKLLMFFTEFFYSSHLFILDNISILFESKEIKKIKTFLVNYLEMYPCIIFIQDKDETIRDIADMLIPIDEFPVK